MLLSPSITQSIYIFGLGLAASIPLSYRHFLATASIVECNAKDIVKVLDLRKEKSKIQNILKLRSRE